MRTVKTTVYKFSELSDSAKQTAMQWWRNSDCDNFWSEGVFDDAATIADLMGLDIRLTRKNSGNYEPSIYYSGFSSQGDGACFEGIYRYKKGSVKDIKAYAPEDAEISRIAKALQDIQKKYFYKLTARTKHRGHYYHEYCMAIDVDYSGDDSRDITDAENVISEALRDFARWIYKQLETEYEYQNSDETVSENIISNEYEFDESGDRI